MKEKVGTILDREIMHRTRMRAAQEGKPVGRILEEALRAYLATRGTGNAKDIVAKMWGSLKLSKRQLKEVLDADIFEA